MSNIIRKFAKHFNSQQKYIYNVLRSSVEFVSSHFTVMVAYGTTHKP